MSTATRTVAACAACICLGIGAYQVPRRTPPQHSQIRPLRAFNPTVAVVTCSTAGVAHAFDFSVNVCAGQTWKGFGWKLKQLLKYLKTQDNEAVFVLLDGADAFVNRGAFAFELEAIWKRLDADVVVASEEACAAVEDCYDDMVRYLYRNLSRSKSAFVNSPIAGTGWALQTVLTAMIEYGGGRDAADDQLAATQLVNGNIALPPTLRVVHDTHQDLFGSFVHLAKYNKNERRLHRARWFKPPKKFTCTDGGGNLHVLGCINVGIRNDGDSYITLNDDVQYEIQLDPRANCNVERANSLLSNAPVFWHGNGPSKVIFRKMQQKRVRCLAETAETASSFFTEH